MHWWTLQQLKSAKPEVRARAARSLGAAKNQRAVPSLIRRVEDENAQVRMAAIEALGIIGHPASAGPLVSALANPVKTVNPPRSCSDSGVESAHYKALANALARVGPPAVSPLLGLLRSNEKEPRRWAAYTLGLLKDSRAVDPLIERLDDSRSEVRKTAARALGEIGDVRAVQALIRTLANRDWETRRAVAEALGFIGSEGAVSALAKVAEDQSEPVQIAAVGALGKIGGLPGAASLRLAATSERKAVREAAKSALKSIKFSPAGPEPRTALPAPRPLRPGKPPTSASRILLPGLWWR